MPRCCSAEDKVSSAGRCDWEGMHASGKPTAAVKMNTRYFERLPLSIRNENAYERRGEQRAGSLQPGEKVMLRRISDTGITLNATLTGDRRIIEIERM